MQAPASRGQQRADAGRRRRWAAPLAVALAGLALGGSFCDETPQAGEGNLDRPGGVVAFHAGDRNYALIPLPQIQHVRAFSLTSFVFVPAPNVYFPLSIPVGPYTHRMAVDEAHGLAFALDSADGALRAVRLGVVSDPEAFTRVGEPIPVGLGPSGVVADPDASSPRLFVSSALSGEVLEIQIDGDVEGHEIVRVLPAGSRPSDLALAADLGLLVVAEADGPEVWLIDLDSGAIRGVDVGGPTARVLVARTALATEVEGESIALALRLDAPELAVLRPAAADPLLATVQLPDLPVDAAVFGSEQHGAGVCGGIDDSGRCEYAAVVTMSGRLYYVDLAARGVGGLPQPRIYDTDDAPPGSAGDPNADEALYDPNEEDPDAARRRPQVEVAAIDDFGTPPRTQQSEDVVYLFTYEGVVAPIRERRGRYDLTQNVFSDLQHDVDLVALGAEAGDLLVVPAQVGCDDPLRLPILDVQGPRLQLAGASGDLDCLAQSGGVRYSVRVDDQFTVAFEREDEAPGILGRAAWDAPYQAKTVLITLRQATDGSGAPLGPPATGAALAVRIEDNFAPRALYLGTLSALPTGLAAIQTSDSEQTWRLLVSTAGGSSLYVVEPGAQGSPSLTGYLPTGVLRYE